MCPLSCYRFFDRYKKSTHVGHVLPFLPYLF
jgi:hypothetical protein